MLELSSFQLMTMGRSPHIAVITNLSPNHLDVHKDFAEYITAKENIFTHQNAQDVAVFNADNSITAQQAERALGRAFSATIAAAAVHWRVCWCLPLRLYCLLWS